MRRSMSTSIAALVFCASAAVPFVALAQRAEKPQSPSVADWTRDIDYLVRKFQIRHPDPYHKHRRSQWLKTAETLKSRLPDAAPHEIILGLARLVALSADGHSGIRSVPANLRAHFDERRFPFFLYHFSDGRFLHSVHDDFAAALGKRVVQLAGTPIEDVYQKIRPFISADNEASARGMAGHRFMTLPTVLHAAGVTPTLVNQIQLSLVDGQKAPFSIPITANTDAAGAAHWRSADSDTSSPLPLYRRLNRGRAYAYEYLEDQRILYVCYNQVRNDADESIAAFFKRVFDFVDSHDVDKFVLDIRNNGGGNNYLNQPILHGLIRAQKINRPGKLFVIIGRRTFSAAMNLAMEIEGNTYALFVGEPTGALPNHYGDAISFKLPRSGITVRCSELYWQNSDPRDKRPWITPDIPAEQSFADFVSHRDPALEAIRRYEADPALAESFGPPNTRWQRRNQQR